MKKLFVLFLSLIVFTPSVLSFDVEKDCKPDENGKGYWCPNNLMKSPEMEERFQGTAVSIDREKQNKQIRDMFNGKHIITPDGNVTEINVDFGGNIKAKPMYKIY